MPDATTLLVFCLVSVALLVTPGPAVLYIVARSVAQGTKAGIVSSLGLIVGGLILVTIGAVGVSALVAESTLAFDALRVVGSGYLIFLGIRQFITFRKATVGNGTLENRRLWQVFREAVLVNLLNPKAALFILALLPQFIDPGSGNGTAQFLILGAVFFALAFVTDSLYALVAGRFGKWIQGNASLSRLQVAFTGAVYLILGVGTALG